MSAGYVFIEKPKRRRDTTVHVVEPREKEGRHRAINTRLREKQRRGRRKEGKSRDTFNSENNRKLQRVDRKGNRSILRGFFHSARREIDISPELFCESGKVGVWKVFVNFYSNVHTCWKTVRKSNNLIKFCTTKLWKLIAENWLLRKIIESNDRCEVFFLLHLMTHINFYNLAMYKESFTTLLILRTVLTVQLNI